MPHDPAVPDDADRPQGRSARPRRRVLRGPVRLVATVGLIGGVLLLVQAFVLPPVVKKIVAEALAGMGYRDVTFDVRAVSFVQTEIADLRLDAQDVNRIGRVIAEYSLGTLLDGRIKALRLERAEVALTVRADGSIDPGPLALRASDERGKPRAGPRDGRLPFDRLELVDSRLAVQWEERKLSIPVRGTVWDMGGGASSIELLAEVRGSPLRVWGTMRSMGEQIELTAQSPRWKLTELMEVMPARIGEMLPDLAGDLEFDGSFRQQEGRMTIAAKARAVLPVATTRPTTQLAAGDELHVSGFVGVDASVEVVGGQVKPVIAVTVRNGAVAMNGFALEGLTGGVTLDGLSPLRSPGGQKLSFNTLTAGQLRFTEGVLNFGLDNTTVRLEQARWRWSQGYVELSPLAFDWTRPALATTISAEGMELAEVLAAFGEGKVSGQGSVFGRVPLKLVWPQVKVRGAVATKWDEPSIELGEGFVHAAPGGTLKITSPEELLGDVLEKQDPRFRKGGQMEDVKANLMSALRNLRYGTLKLDIVNEEEHLLARLRVAGRPAQGGDVRDVTVNFRGLEDSRYILSLLKKVSFE